MQQIATNKPTCLGHLNMLKNMLFRINQWSVPHHFCIIAIICRTNKLERNKPIAITNGLICTVTLLQLKILKIDVSDVFQRNEGKSFSRKKLIETDMLNYKCSHIPNTVYLVPEPRLVKQNSQLNMEFNSKDGLELIEKGFKKLANSVSVLKH